MRIRARVRAHTYAYGPRPRVNGTRGGPGGESRFTFLFRVLSFFSLRPPSRLPTFPSLPPSLPLSLPSSSPESVNERAHNQPPLPSPLSLRRRLATLAGDGISHSKCPPRRGGGLTLPRPTRFLASNPASPDRASCGAYLWKEYKTLVHVHVRVPGIRGSSVCMRARVCASR